MEYARENLKTPENLKKVNEAMEKIKEYFQKEFATKEQNQLLFCQRALFGYFHTDVAKA